MDNETPAAQSDCDPKGQKKIPKNGVISKGDKRILFYRGLQEAEIVIEEALSYTPLGHRRRKWDSNIVGMTPAEFETFVYLARRDLSSQIVEPEAVEPMRKPR